MSRYDYEMSRDPRLLDAPFHALIMAAMRRADTGNLRKLRKSWPDVYVELYRRYNAPGGELPGDTSVQVTVTSRSEQ